MLVKFSSAGMKYIVYKRISVAEFPTETLHISLSNFQTDLSQSLVFQGPVLEQLEAHDRAICI